MNSKYDPLPMTMPAEEMQAYMDKQPSMLAMFDKHAEAETSLFRECGLICKCEVPNIDFHPTNCETCGLPWRRETVLAAELQR